MRWREIYWKARRVGVLAHRLFATRKSSDSGASGRGSIPNSLDRAETKQPVGEYTHPTCLHLSFAGRICDVTEFDRPDAGAIASAAPLSVIATFCHEAME
jgi:hypothetical protein